MSGLYQRFKDWENARAGFSPGGLPPSPMNAPIDLTSSRPPISTVAPTKLEGHGIYETEAAFVLVVTQTPYGVMYPGTTVIPQGAIVHWTLGISGVMATKETATVIVIRSRGPSPPFIDYALCPATGTVSGVFEMTATDYLDVYAVNTDTDGHEMGFAWQAVTQ